MRKAAMFILLFTAAAYGEELSLIGAGSYEYLSLSRQNLHSPGAVFILNRGNPRPASIAETSSLNLTAAYRYYGFEKDLLYRYPDEFHTIDFSLNGWEKRHQYLIVLTSHSDEPFSGGANTWTAGAAYAYTFVHSGRFLLSLGLGVATTDHRVVPIPVVRMRYDMDWLEASLDFFTAPYFGITLFPQNRLSLHAEVGISSFDSLRDIYFDTYAEYQLLKDWDISARAGFKVDGDYFELSTDKTFDYQYYAVYGALDLGIAQLSGGYAFEGREQYDDKHKRNTGDGYFISLMVGYIF